MPKSALSMRPSIAMIMLGAARVGGGQSTQTSARSQRCLMSHDHQGCGVLTPRSCRRRRQSKARRLLLSPTLSADACCSLPSINPEAEPSAAALVTITSDMLGRFFASVHNPPDRCRPPRAERRIPASVPLHAARRHDGARHTPDRGGCPATNYAQSRLTMTARRHT